jgi:quinohemoprotein ethanol dehydrogenase
MRFTTAESGVRFVPQGMRRLSLVAAAALLVAGCTGATETGSAQGAANVDSERLGNADRHADQWMSYGRTWDEQRYSPLKQIHAGNVKGLGLEWFADLNSRRGVEANPLYVDGVLYNIISFNIVTAYDAKTGRVLWTYDPKVEPQWARYACCGPSTRGLAVWKGKVYVAALDGRLIALDARNGQELWTVQTVDQSQPFTITGPPRVFDGKVVIGNAGGDYGVRAFVSAYDAQTGQKIWKFYTVPGNPADGPDGEASDSVMEMATKTWTGEWWKVGGGGSAWDSIVYDPKLKLVYFATGNGAPIVHEFRSPQGGDNLFLCSIVAVNSETGEYVWHYQEVPEEQWDYDCTQSMVLADLKIDGRDRQVLLHAPKNGFFYVLDRKTGELLSAKNFTPNTWASHIDMKTGRPVVYKEAYLSEKPRLMTPSAGGAHNWNPMGYSPDTGLVYIPVHEQWYVFAKARTFKYVPFRPNSGLSFGSDPAETKALLDEADRRDNGYLLAWDPVQQKEAFRIPYGKQGSGGVLLTAGNLLVQGTIHKTFAIYRADNGEKLWEMPVDNVPISSPITYMLDGEQYIAVNAGWGGGLAHVDMMLGKKQMPVAPARLLVFKLNAKNVPLPPAPPAPEIDEPPPLRASEEQIRRGGELFNQTCSSCHGVNARGGLKDLRIMSRQTHAEFNDIVLKGTRADKGMANFSDIISQADADAIHAYLIARAHEDWNKDTSGTAAVPDGADGAAAGAQQGAGGTATPPTGAAPATAPAGAANAPRAGMVDVIIDDTDVYPESITAMSDGTLINGSVKGVVYRALRTQDKATPWIRSTPQNGMLSVLGVLADEKANTLWLCSAAMPVPGAPPANGKPSSLMAFDLRTGEQKGSYPFPPPNSACNDIAIDSDGTAYATDTPNGRIFRLAPGAKALELYAQDEKLKGVDGIAFAGDGTLYVNIVTRGAILRIERKADRSFAGTTELALSETIKGPDGFRPIEGNRFLQAQGQGGRVDEVIIRGDTAHIRKLRDGLNSPPGVTLVGNTVYAIEGKLGYLMDPALKGQDPGVFKATAIALPPALPAAPSARP